MIFRTEIELKESEYKIMPEDKIFSIGSCFSSEISDFLARGQLQTFNNPFGTIFNPFSVNTALQRLHDAKNYTPEELILFNDNYISLDHHTDFDTAFSHKTLEKINTQIEAGNQFLQGTTWVIITYGTAYIHEFLPKNKLVANCHKIPAVHFRKRFLEQQEMSGAIRETILAINDICDENVQILFTVSPVRHTRDGIAENSLSKAKLLTALHESIEGFRNCHYLPIYEIMMDDLRDYRFYKEDMIHPNAQALHYIFEKFGNAYLSDEAMDFIETNLGILKNLNHKPKNPDSADHLKMLEKLKEKIKIQQQKVRYPIFSNDLV